MPTLTASRRAVLAIAVGLVLPLALGACSDDRSVCSLRFIEGDLVADDGRVVLVHPNLVEENHLVPLDWPDGWTVRPTDDGQLEVVDDSGTVLARTGEGIKLEGVADPHGSGPWIRDGELVVCPIGMRRT